MTTIARPSTPFPHTHAISYSSYFDAQPASSASSSSSKMASYNAFASGSGSSNRRYSQPLHFQLPTIPARTPPSLLKRTASASSSSSTSTSTDANGANKHFRATLSPSTPPLIARRESASSTTSTSTEASFSSSADEPASPPMPATPPHSNVVAPLPLPIAAPTAKSSQQQKQQHHQANFAAFYPEFALDSFDGPLTAIEILEDDLYDLKRSQAEEFYHPATTPPSTPAPASVQQGRKSFDPTYYPPRSLPALAQTTSVAPVSRPKFKRRDTPRPVETIASLAFSSLGRQRGTTGAGAGIMQQMEAMMEERPERRRSYTSMVDGGKWVVV